MVIVCQLISHCTSAWVVASKAAINISIYSTLFSCEDAKNSALPVAWFSRTYSVMPGRGKKNKKEEKGKKRELRGAASSVTKHKRTYCSRSVWKRNSIHVKWTFTLETPLGMNTGAKLRVSTKHPIFSTLYHSAVADIRELFFRSYSLKFTLMAIASWSIRHVVTVNRMKWEGKITHHDKQFKNVWLVHVRTDSKRWGFFVLSLERSLAVFEVTLAVNSQIHVKSHLFQSQREWTFCTNDQTCNQILNKWWQKKNKDKNKITLNLQISMISSWRWGLEVCNEVLTLSLLFDASEDHFSSRNVLLGVLQVYHQGVVTPCDTCR